MTTTEFNPAIHTSSFFKDLSSRHSGNKTHMSQELGISRASLNRWMSKTNGKISKPRKRNNTPKRSTRSPVTPRKESRDIIFTVDKRDLMTMLKIHVEKTISRQMEEYGEPSKTAENLYKRVWAPGSYQRTTLESGISYFVDMLQEMASANKKN